MNPLVIVGAGHNGLTAAFYLARAGRKTIVLERRSTVGGCAVTGEIAPGYRCPTLAHAIGPLRAAVVRDMQLARRLEFVHADVRVAALPTDGGEPLRLYRDQARTVDALRTSSAADADGYTALSEAFQKIGAFLAPILESTPPSIDDVAARELWDLLKAGKRFRALGARDGHRLLRWLPMAVADLVGEFFSSDLLQAVVAARGIFATAAGPWSAGTGAVLLLSSALDPAPGGNSVSVKGGPGALTKAMADAAREAGAEIRVGAGVSRILVRDGAVVGVALSDGSEIAASAVVCNADPKRTFLDLIDPAELDPEFLTRIRNYRCRGTVAKVNLALNALPPFTSLTSDDLQGRIHIGPSIDYLERAFDNSKYGEMSEEPYLEATLPSLADPSLAPPGCHVLSVYMQYAPYAIAGGWNGARRHLRDIVLRTLERHAPGLGSAIEHCQVITPADLDEEFGLTGGHVHHGEPALDQLFTMRPVLGWAQYRTPIRDLYLCGAGTHPGGGITGGPGQNAAREILRDLKSRS